MKREEEKMDLVTSELFILACIVVVPFGPPVLSNR